MCWEACVGVFASRCNNLIEWIHVSVYPGYGAIIAFLDGKGTWHKQTTDKACQDKFHDLQQKNKKSKTNYMLFHRQIFFGPPFLTSIGRTFVGTVPCLLTFFSVQYINDSDGCLHKNIEIHTADTIVSWPNHEQWVIVRTSYLMMVIRQSIYILSIITRGMG